MPSLPDAAHALRYAVAVTRLAHVHVLRIAGADARAALARLCAGAIRVRDGQLQHVLLLQEDGTPFADAFLLCDDEAFDLLYEGPGPEEMRAHAARHLPATCDVTLEDRSRTHAIVGLDGPFAWELVSRIAGAEVVGLPYLTFFKTDEYTCYRAGKTGEYGYGLVVARAACDALEQRLLTAGADLDAIAGTREALELAALENFFFNIHREGRAGLTPLELQLQWRVDGAGDGVGVAAVRARRSEGQRARVTTLRADARLAEGDAVRLGDAVIGRVLQAAWSPVAGAWIALALLDLPWAIPGLDALRVGDADAPARSVSPPVLNNKSLFVSAQMHAYATRDEIALPPLVRR